LANKLDVRLGVLVGVAVQPTEASIALACAHHTCESGLTLLAAEYGEGHGMSLLQIELDRIEHPVDIIERIAALNEG
jgi:hypothetical protein